MARWRVRGSIGLMLSVCLLIPACSSSPSVQQHFVNDVKSSGAAEVFGEDPHPPILQEGQGLCLALGHGATMGRLSERLKTDEASGGLPAKDAKDTYKMDVLAVKDLCPKYRDEIPSG